MAALPHIFANEIGFINRKYLDDNFAALGGSITVNATGSPVFDALSINAAITAASDYQTIVLSGNFTLASTITLKPKIKIDGSGATIVLTNSAVDLFSYTPGTPTGYPGNIILEHLNLGGPGAIGTCAAIRIDANAPFCTVRNCVIAGFYEGIYLRDCYSSSIEDCLLTTFVHGIRLYRESHAVNIYNTFVDLCSIAALSINYGGGAGTGPTHNVNVIGGAFQNSSTGIWLEQSLEFHSFGVYHEGNTSRDYRVGVADGGVYGRACYNAIIDGFSSSSACAGDMNVKIEHSVGCKVLGAGWNSGCSTTNTLLAYDGFSDRIEVDVLRYTTAAPTATAPVNFTADQTRGQLYYKGRAIYGVGVPEAVQYGNLASIYSRIYQGFTGGGREALTMESLIKDMQLRVPEVGRLQDSAGTDYFVWDPLNGVVTVQKPFNMSGQTTSVVAPPAGGAGALPATPAGYLVTTLNGVSRKIPYY